MQQNHPDRATQNPRQSCSDLELFRGYNPWLGLRSIGRWKFVVLTAMLAALCLDGLAQDALPFAVSNPKNKKWPPEEASRIYFSVCDLVARRVSPQRPPHLHPKFLLVLGAKENEAVHNSTVSEIRLKSWNPANFAEGAVIMASREIVNTEQMVSIAREALLSAQVKVSVEELRQEK
jgi:hypothetical protein